MATPSSILAWFSRRTRGDWWASVHGVTELDTTEATQNAHNSCIHHFAAVYVYARQVHQIFGDFVIFLSLLVSLLFRQMELTANVSLKIPINLNLGINGHLGRKDAGKGEM